jgi:hypothetical protein
LCQSAYSPSPSDSLLDQFTGSRHPGLKFLLDSTGGLGEILNENAVIAFVPGAAYRRRRR